MRALTPDAVQFYAFFFGVSAEKILALYMIVDIEAHRGRIRMPL